MRTAALLTVALVLPLSAGARQPNPRELTKDGGDPTVQPVTKAHRVELTAPAVPASTPALRFELLPPARDRMPGNAALGYLKAVAAQPAWPKDPGAARLQYDKVLKLEEARPDQVSVRDLAEFLKTYRPMLRMADEAARFERSERVLSAMAYRQALPLSVTEKLVDMVSDKVRDHILAHISHELRTPLNAIFGYLEMLSDHVGVQLQPELQKCISGIQVNSERLLAYFEGLFFLTELDAGTFRVERREFAVQPWLKQVLLPVLRAAAHRDASVEVVCDEALVGFSLAIVLVSRHLATSGEIGATLLLVYWALRLPDLGQRIGDLARQYPGHRTRTLRLLEPLGAPDEEASLRRPAADAEAREPAAARSGGARIDYEGITVVAAGTTIVREVDLRIEPGSHLAIVGPSGAGKSSLIALLLGFHTPTEGTLRIDGVPLDGPDLTRLRRQTAWIDPAIQLWNRPLLDNLTYGTADPALEGLPLVLSQSDLIDVLANLPDGLQTQLGEGGAGLSGGEGQRVRVARAMLRPGVRLVILDEPLRGLDRGRRRALMTRLRQFWPEATLLCITHDVELTLDFPRVVVVDGGRVVEDGDPRALEAQADGAFFAMLKRERDVRERLWSHASWRRLQMAGGRVEERA